eukprot:490187_1
MSGTTTAFVIVGIIVFIIVLFGAHIIHKRFLESQSELYPRWGDENNHPIKSMSKKQKDKPQKQSKEKEKSIPKKSKNETKKDSKNETNNKTNTNDEKKNNNDEEEKNLISVVTQNNASEIKSDNEKQTKEENWDILDDSQELDKIMDLAQVTIDIDERLINSNHDDIRNSFSEKGGTQPSKRQSTAL